MDTLAADRGESTPTNPLKIRMLRIAQTLRRYAGAVVPIAAALGIGAADLIRGGSALGEWVRTQGPWGGIALIALGLWVIHVIHSRQAQTEAREAQAQLIAELRAQQAQQTQAWSAGLEKISDTLGGRIRELADRVESMAGTAPHRRVTTPPSPPPIPREESIPADADTDPKWPPLPSH